MTGARVSNDQPRNLSPEGWPLLARYDLEAIGRSADRDAIAARNPLTHPGFWKWRELLPVGRDEDVVSLGEMDTPLVELKASAAEIGVSGRLWSKEEGRLPTGSFKARGLALAVSMAKSYGVTRRFPPMALVQAWRPGASAPRTRRR